MSGDEHRSALRLDSKVFGEGVVLRALYWLSNRCSGEIRRASNGDIEVLLFAKPGMSFREEEVISAFRDRLVDEALRAQIREETAGIRELIFAKAFAAPGVLEDVPPGDDRDPVERDG